MRHLSIFLTMYLIAFLLSSGSVATAGFPFFKGKDEVKASAGAGSHSSTASSNQVTPPGTLLKKLESKEDKARFIRLATERDLARNHVQTLREISAEKQAQLKQANQELKENFGVFPDRDYEFDAAQGIVYQVSETVRESVLVLPEGERRDSFISLVQTKTSAKQSLPTLNNVLQEKRIQAVQIGAELEWRFGLPVDQDFYYDGKRGSIYLLTTPPSQIGK